jgi:deazaflavin-dependent oxidoreductase (nitroreductase family)
MPDSEGAIQRASDDIQQHLADYLESNGRVGYVRDLSRFGGCAASLHLILRTVGRRSGREILVPLLYFPWVDEFIVVASNAGAELHPDWYLNLTSRPDVRFQVRQKRFAGSWRAPSREERQTLWNYVCAMFPPYVDYQQRTRREIPLIILTATSLDMSASAEADSEAVRGNQAEISGNHESRSQAVDNGGRDERY